MALPEKRQKLTKEEKEARRQQIKDIKAQRKELKRDLRLNGMKSRHDFEFFAEEVGMVYPEGTIQAAWCKFVANASGFGGWLKRSLTTTTIVIIILLLLAALFIIAYVTEEKGHFTVNVTADMLRNGFELSTDEEFEKTETRLFAEEIRNSNATSVYEMNRGVSDADGANNGPGYMGYSFYIRNNGTEPTSYGYTVNILSSTLGTDKATWLMFYEDGKQIIYAKAQDNGNPESLWGYPTAPYIEDAFNADAQYFYENEKWGIKTTPFIDDNTALQGYVEDLQPGEVKRYSVVIWLEGDDPDCNNSILGGHCGFNIQFDRIGSEEEGYFKGLYRTEYEKSFNAEDTEDYSHERSEHEAHSNTSGTE